MLVEDAIHHVKLAEVKEPMVALNVRLPWFLPTMACARVAVLKDITAIVTRSASSAVANV